ncbi:MAG: PolC-type DNA polymerase III [Ruminococcaceae bacterium]|nr:PolC-type DNA polymerase III [Oscillospiraceae bacterium]
MPDLNLGDIFTSVNVPIPLKDIKVLSVNANKEEKSVSVVILTKKVIEYAIIENYKEEVKRAENLNSLVIKLKYDNVKLEEIAGKKYFENLMFYVNTLSPGTDNLFIDSDWEYENGKITVRCKNGLEMINATHCKDLIKKLVLAQVGQNVEVEFIDEYDVEKYLKQRQEIVDSFEPIVVPVRDEIKYEMENGEEDKDAIIYGKYIFEKPVKISRITNDTTYAVVEGEIFSLEDRETKSGRIIVSYCITDLSSSYNVKMFLTKKKYEELKNSGFKNGIYAKISGGVEYDEYSKEMVIIAKNINKAEKVVRSDNAERKRVELHMHTKMSAMDGMTDVKTLIAKAAEWGHKAVAVTDHGNVQAFPDAAIAASKNGIKVIYGVECYLVSDSLQIVYNTKDITTDGEFIVFDIETTGLNPATDTITEIGAVRVKDKQVLDVFQTFVNPERKIPKNIVELTGITDEMVADAPKIDEALESFYEFVGDAALVAHNATFDTGFIKAAASKCNMDFNFCFIDTVEFSRALLKNQVKNHKLNTLAAYLNISLENHHRASDDATATAHIFIKLIEMTEEKGIYNISQFNTDFAKDADEKNQKTHHAIILVKNYTGLKNLYHIISKSHLDHFYKRPRVPKSLLNEYREGLLLGSACEAGELYSAIIDGKPFGEIMNIIKYYDYLEIQPLGNNQFLIDNGRVSSEMDLKQINKNIIEWGKRNNKLTVATCDVHFLNPEDEVFRRILMAGQGFSDADNQAPLYFRTTEEMLEEFKYLGDALAEEVVIDNPNKISDMCEEILPVPDETAPPVIDGSDDELRDSTMSKAYELYGEDLHPIIKDRIDAELTSIIDNGYSVLYIIARRLVQKSLSDGYLVGSRGSVGSSFVAFLSGITEVNSLAAHYICKKCKYLEFNKDPKYSCGFDLPKKKCPVCGEELTGDGHDIPFETFLGFGGGKEPDIDLNFSGDYQSVAHKYTEELFGEGYVFRAGTIGTIAEKTAYGFVKKYFESKGISVCSAEINRLVQGCAGVKRTTGQHPGGVMIVPRTRDVHEFTPIQYPADDSSSGTITTHFDYHSISGRLLKLDILGHDDPTVIRMLEDLTKTNAREIPFSDEKVMSLFHSTEALGVKSEDINSVVGTYAVPEFGTNFVRKMLVDTKPSTFAEIVRISGLSHGTDVWLNNAQDLITSGTTTLSEAICTRDDIMLYLISKGVEPKMSFKIMESVRKGKGLNDEWEAAMRENNVPQWYIDSCKKIKYMFPKAHAVAYVTMAYRIAWYKVNYPKEFYSTYFTVRADDFDAQMMINGRETVLENIAMLEAKGNAISAKEKNVLTILEVCNEMYSRGLKFLPIHVYTSEAFKFVPTEEGIVPPLNAIAGLGTNAALSIVEERDKKQFTTIDDLTERAKVNKTVIAVMKEQGCLDGIPNSNQMSFFDM